MNMSYLIVLSYFTNMINYNIPCSSDNFASLPLTPCGSRVDWACTQIVGTTRAQSSLNSTIMKFERTLNIQRAARNVARTSLTPLVRLFVNWLSSSFTLNKKLCYQQQSKQQMLPLLQTQTFQANQNSLSLRFSHQVHTFQSLRNQGHDPSPVLQLSRPTPTMCV